MRFFSRTTVPPEMRTAGETVEPRTSLSFRVNMPEPMSRQPVEREFTFDCSDTLAITACDVPWTGAKVMQGAFAGAMISTPAPGPRSP